MKRRVYNENLPPDRGTGITPLPDGISYSNDHLISCDRLI